MMPPDDTTKDACAVISALRAERDAALAREAALAEVLTVINHSPGDPGPVFQTILQKAHSLCGVTIGSLGTYDGTYLRIVAAHGYPLDSVLRPGFAFRPTAANSQRLIDGERLVHYADVTAMPAEAVSNFRDVVERLGVRTVLLVPLRKDGLYVGGFSALRTEVRPFTEAEISLLESFAAQAVIAMENARLLDELRQRQEELRITFENMGDGVSMYDATPRLVTWEPQASGHPRSTR
jgi:GAF domain-containing protein